MSDGLKELIDSCNLTNFNDDQEKVISDYVINFINSHQLPIQDCALGLLEGKTFVDFTNLKKNPILQNYSFYIEQCKLLFKRIYDKYVREKKNSDFKTCLGYLVSNSFMLLTSINTLLISGLF